MIAETETVCATCGMGWEEEAGASEFGCWSCGGMQSVVVSPTQAIELMYDYNQSRQANQPTKQENNN